MTCGRVEPPLWLPSSRSLTILVRSLNEILLFPGLSFSSIKTGRHDAPFGLSKKDGSPATSPCGRLASRVPTAISRLGSLALSRSWPWSFGGGELPHLVADDIGDEHGHELLAQDPLKVSPTISGSMVECCDQVLMTFLDFVRWG